MRKPDLKMTRWIVPICLWLATAVAIADLLPLDTFDGGGSIGGAFSGGIGVRLNGAIAGYGLPNGFAGRSATGTENLGVGYYPALAATFPFENAADPAWMQLARSPRDARNDPAQRTAALVNPHAKPGTILERLQSRRLIVPAIQDARPLDERNKTTRKMERRL